MFFAPLHVAVLLRQVLGGAGGRYLRGQWQDLHDASHVGEDRMCICQGDLFHYRRRGRWDSTMTLRCEDGC